MPYGDHGDVLTVPAILVSHTDHWR